MIVPILLSALAWILAYAGSGRQLSKGQFAIVALFLGGGAALVLFPGWANLTAATLGVGRGADLLLYFAVLSGVLIAANFYFRLKQNQRVIAEIVRRLALLTPVSSECGEAPAAPGGAWVVIPAYNEAEALRGVAPAVREVIPCVVVVDDGSTDETSAEATAAGAAVLRHAVNLGQGAALATGIRYALSRGAGYVFTFDADGQHDPASLLALAKALPGADVVLGSRTLGRADGMPAARRLLLKLALAFTRLHSGLRVSDTHNGLRLFTREAASRITITQPGMAHASEILEQIHSLGLRYVEAPVTVRYTEYSLRKGQPLSAAFGILIELFYANWTK